MTRYPFIVLAVVLTAAMCAVADDDAAPLRLRVLSYNIHHGRGADGKIDLPRIAKVINDAKPDLVALQEVDRKTSRAGGVDQAAELGKLTGMRHAFGKAMDYSGGEYGEAVLSRVKPTAVTNHALPATAGHEPRSALAIDLRLRGDAGPLIRLIGTHLDHTDDPTNRVMQAKAINKKLTGDDAPPSILVGDLNAEPGSPAMKVLAERWTLVTGDPPPKTWPADEPRVAIDHALVRPAANWRVVEVQVIDEKVASDHRPLLVVLEWKPAP